MGGGKQMAGRRNRHICNSAINKEKIYKIKNIHFSKLNYQSQNFGQRFTRQIFRNPTQDAKKKKKRDTGKILQRGCSLLWFLFLLDMPSSGPWPQAECRVLGPSEVVMGQPEAISPLISKPQSSPGFGPLWAYHCISPQFPST